MKKHAEQLLLPVDPSLQARFNEGHSFEAYAEARFPGLVRIGFEDSASYQELTSKTNDAWKKGASAVAQGRYEAGQLTCIADILSRDDRGFVLTEIKSSSTKKLEHVYDLAFQRIVLEKAGFSITCCQVALVNTDYVRIGELEPERLVRLEDITSEVEEEVESTGLLIDQALKVAGSKEMPDPAPERARLNSYGEWLKIREVIDPRIPRDSIHRLPFMSAETASKLIEAGISTIDNINEHTQLGNSTRRYLNARTKGARSVNIGSLHRFLQKIQYPVHYLDYETSQNLLPPWEGTRPYQQVPFQYSLHVQHDPSSSIEHREYLHRGNSNPMPALLEKLRKDVGETGSILVWYDPFEKTRNKEMALSFPEHAAFLNNLNARVIDLMHPFADETVKDPLFKGSASIKAVLPVLVPNLSYDDLEIQEGASASRLWKEVALTNPEHPERESVFADLIKYCCRDTWAMVEIHRKLREM